MRMNLQTNVTEVSRGALMSQLYADPRPKTILFKPIDLRDSFRYCTGFTTSGRCENVANNSKMFGFDVNPTIFCRSTTALFIVNV